MYVNVCNNKLDITFDIQQFFPMLHFKQTIENCTYPIVRGYSPHYHSPWISPSNLLSSHSDIYKWLLKYQHLKKTQFH